MTKFTDSTNVITDASSLAYTCSFVSLSDLIPNFPCPPLNNFLGFFNFLETICLYDTVTFKVPGPFIPDSFNPIERGSDDLCDQDVCAAATAKLISFCPIFEEFRKEGLIQCASVEQLWDAAAEKHIKLPPEEYQRGLDLLKEVAESKENSMLKAVLYFNRILGYSYLPDLEETLTLPSKLNSLCVQSPLQAAYDDLSSALKTDVELLRAAGRPIDIFIPPIPAIILDKVSSPKEIPEATLEVREKLSSVRSAFRDYEIAARNDKISLKESLSARYRLHDISKNLSLKYDNFDRITVTELRDTFDILPKSPKELSEFEEGKISKFLFGKPFTRAISLYRNRNIMYLFRLRDQFLRIKEYGHLIKKVYGFDVTDKEIQELEVQKDKVDDAIDKIGS